MLLRSLAIEEDLKENFQRLFLLSTAEILQKKHLGPSQCLLSSVVTALIYDAGGVDAVFFSIETFEPTLQARSRPQTRLLDTLVLIFYLLFWCHSKFLGTSTFIVQLSNLIICVEIWAFFFFWAMKDLLVLVR